jgi:hypothetical protein
MTAPHNSPVRRSLRRFTLGSGPLKRRSDRLQVVGRFVVVLSFLLAPPLAVAAATATTSHLQEVADAEHAARSPTSAVLLEEAGDPVTDGTDSGGYSVARVQARAEWAVPGGGSREGIVLAPPRTAAGTVVPVWVDGEGNLTRAPFDRAAIPMSAYVMGALPLVGMPLAAWTVYAVLCFALNASRERKWERDWAAVEPDWHSKLL